MRRSVLASLLLAGCALSAGQVTDTENNLTAAGFQVRPVNTPQRQAMITKLTPNKLTQGIRGQNVAYFYADPKVCQCLYAGDQAAFSRYLELQQAQRVASEQLEAAQLQSEWDWQPWGYNGIGDGGFPRRN